MAFDSSYTVAIFASFPLTHRFSDGNGGQAVPTKTLSRVLTPDIPIDSC